MGYDRDSDACLVQSWDEDVEDLLIANMLGIRDQASRQSDMFDADSMKCI